MGNLGDEAPFSQIYDNGNNMIFIVKIRTNNLLHNGVYFLSFRAFGLKTKDSATASLI